MHMDLNDEVVTIVYRSSCDNSLKFVVVCCTLLYIQTPFTQNTHRMKNGSKHDNGS